MICCVQVASNDQQPVGPVHVREWYSVPRLLLVCLMGVATCVNTISLARAQEETEGSMASEYPTYPYAPEPTPQPDSESTAFQPEVPFQETDFAPSPTPIEEASSDYFAYAPVPVLAKDVEELTFTGLQFDWLPVPGFEVFNFVTGTRSEISCKTPIMCGDNSPARGVGDILTFVPKEAKKNAFETVQDAANAKCKDKYGVFKFARIVPVEDWDTYSASIESCGGDPKGKSGIASFSLKLKVQCVKKLTCGATKVEYENTLATFAFECAVLLADDQNADCIGMFADDYESIMECAGGNFDDDYEIEETANPIASPVLDSGGKRSY